MQIEHNVVLDSILDTKSITSEEISVGLECDLVVCRLSGKELPNMDHNFGSKLNSPLRALVLRK